METQPAKGISGMALGWDQAWAIALHNLGIPFDAYVPFLGQESMWPAESQAAYKEILGWAATINYVCPPGYAAWKMQARNVAMDRDCDVMVALYDGTSGGTSNCVKACKSPVLNVWDRWIV